MVNTDSEITQNGEVDNTALAMALLKQLSKKTVENVTQQADGYYTVSLKSSKEGGEDQVLENTYRYKPKQESTSELLSLSFPVDSQGFIYIPKKYPTDQGLSMEAKKSFYLLDTQAPTEVFNYNDEKKKEILETMPSDYYPEVLPCNPSDLCPTSTTGANLSDLSPEGETGGEVEMEGETGGEVENGGEVEKTEGEKVEKNGTQSKEEGSNLNWLWIGLSVGGVLLAIFLIYRFFIRRRRTF